MTKTFGNLTLKQLNRVEQKETPINYIFKNASKRLAKIDVVTQERQIAFDNLMKLTTELQTKRLRYNAKSACKYFTL